MSIKNVKSDEMIVKMDDFGFLVETFIQSRLRYFSTTPEWLDAKLREWWPKLEEYYQRHIMSAIEVAILLDDDRRAQHGGSREPLEYRAMWEKIVKDLRPARSPFTVKYCCGKCKAEGVKLWRQSHTFADYIELQCASCLAPGQKIGDDGRALSDPIKSNDGKVIMEGIMTDQVKSYVPAIPVGDTYWGYSSVPSQDVEWWVALPTYK